MSWRGLILNLRRNRVEIYELRVEGLGETRVIGIVGVSLSFKVDLNSILNLFRKYSSEYNVVFQALNFRVSASLRHVLASVMRAIRAFNDGRNVCDKLEIEILLYISGRRQIRDALRIAGLPEHTKDFILICIGESSTDVSNAISRFLDEIGGEVNYCLLELNEDKISFLKDAFNLSEVELNTVLRHGLSIRDVIERLVIERSALLEVYK